MSEPTPCRRCGGEQYLETDSGQMQICPFCHGTGDNPRSNK